MKTITILAAALLFSACSLLDAGPHDTAEVLRELRDNGTITPEQFQILMDALVYSWGDAVRDLIDTAVVAGLGYMGWKKRPNLLRTRKTKV